MIPFGADGTGDGGGRDDKGMREVKKEEESSISSKVFNDLNPYTDFGKTKHVPEDKPRQWKNEQPEEIFPMKCKPEQDGTTTLKYRPQHEMKQTSSLVLSKLLKIDQKRKERITVSSALADNLNESKKMKPSSILKDSFHFRQIEKDKITVNNESLNSNKETWDMIDKTCLFRPLCNTAPITGSKSNVAPSRIVGSLLKNSDELKMDLEWDNPVLGCSKTLEIPTLTRTKAQKKLWKDDISCKCAFSVEKLREARIVGHIDNKFIACVMRSTDDEDMIVLVDQHAAHERIRLERLIERVGYHSNMNIVSGKLTKLVPPLRFLALEQDRDFLLRYKKEFSCIGLNYSKCGETHSHILVQSVPYIFADGHQWKAEASCRTVNVELLKEFILEQGNYMQATGCECKMSSRIVFQALASYACHGAIRFGDRISMACCEEIMKDLSKCKLPFQCAHGRPSIAPILRLKFLDGLAGTSRVKPDLAKLKRC